MLSDFSGWHVLVFGLTEISLHSYTYVAGASVKSSGAPQALAVLRALPSGLAAHELALYAGPLYWVAPSNSPGFFGKFKVP